MIEIRKANEADFKNLLTLIKQIDEKEKEYLRYDQESREPFERLLKNINEGHVVLFTDSEQVFGFLEYTIKRDEKIWIYSLYFIKEYRKQVYRLVLPTFVAMKESYKLPIHFAVDKKNHNMNRIAKFIKAKPIRFYIDGRIEYKVQEVPE
jgi:hypothetical protein